MLEQGGSPPRIGRKPNEMMREIKPCGHSLPVRLPENTLLTTTEAVRLVVARGDGGSGSQHQQVGLLLYLELPVPAGPVCVRLRGLQFSELATLMDTMRTMNVEQIRALDAALDAAAPLGQAW